MQDALIQKIQELRDIYSEIYKNKETISPERVEEITDQVIAEIREFARTHKIGIDIRLVSASEESYQKYIDEGTVKEFIYRNDGVM